ncbi:MAG: hypothetical protein QM758_01285 [Armatimonas sp.]
MRLKRKTFVKLFGAAALGGAAYPIYGESKIDRKALVGRHRILLTKRDPLTPLTVGNGEFGFTADITGLQTFPEAHQGGMLLQTMAQWSLHETPDSHNYKLSDTFNNYDSYGRSVPYPSGDEAGGGFGDDSPAAQWLNRNPHRFDLGRISLILPQSGEQALKIEDLTDTRQDLNLWTGLLTSQFRVGGQQVSVETVAHPKLNLLAVRITSPLVASGQLGVKLHFPYASSDWRSASDWGQPDRHTTVSSIGEKESSEVTFARQLDGTTKYTAQTVASSNTAFTTLGKHECQWKATGQSTLTFVIAFSPENSKGTPDKLPSFEQVRRSAARHWAGFWSKGGAIDLSDSTDSRWKELERRIVLSQYQTAINSAGSLPPQETGLVQNSWHGKFHLEMHWWHAAHFPLWGRTDLLMRSMDYYRRILPVAQETARRIGCRGARWPKCVGPEGRESPNRINPFLTWQQPHPIHFAELLYQARPTKQTLTFFKDIVLESAEFIATFPHWNSQRNCYELGPPIVAPYENNYPDRKVSKNPAFDLAYWCWALGIAQQWRERLGMPRSKEWDHVRENLAPLPVKERIYREIEELDAGQSGHPTMVGALGVVPETPLVNHATMGHTLDFVINKWPKDDTWGWDYPMMAMAAARLGRPDQAIEALLMDSPKNRYLANGHNYQISILPLYLPGNGGLLFAVALMAAGWKGAPNGNAPGFPSPEKGWAVRWEGLLPAL